MYSVLKITDGTTSVNLLNINRGFLLSDWRPSIAPFKGGGIWQSSPLTDGRRLAMRNFDNSIETFELKLRGNDQDGAIQFVQELVTLLEEAVAYWTTDWQLNPVWIEARGAQETNSRYAVVKSYTIDALGNPYTQPFFGACNLIAMDDFTLIVERDHWTENPPGEETCVQASTLRYIQEESSGVSVVNVPVLASADDMYIQLEGGAALSNGPKNYVGIIPPDGVDMESGLRFQNVTVPQGATIIDAYFIVEVSPTGSDDDYDMDFIINGEDYNNSPAWGSFSDISMANLGDEYLYRKKELSTSATTTWASGAGTWSGEQQIRGLAPIVQEIVDRPGWSSGNAMAFFVGFKVSPETPVHETNARTFYAQDYGSSEPHLVIYYRTTSPETVGREATCDGYTYVANKHDYTMIDFVYYHNLDAGTWSDNRIGHALPAELLPIADAGNCEVGDEIYIGSNTEESQHGPFDSVAMDLLPDYGGDIAITWYYYSDDVSNWATLTVFGNRNFAETGETLMWWTCPDDWVMNSVTIGGVATDGMWIKGVVTAVGTSSPYIQNRDIYTVNTPYLDIDSAQVPGEISALARISMRGTESESEGYASTMVMVSGRSLSRGIDFSPYLIMGTPTQNPRGVSYTAGIAAITEDSFAPGGYSSQATTANEMNDFSSLGQFVFNSSAAIQYAGVFHVFLRLRQYNGNAGDVYFRLKYRGIIGSSTIITEDYPIGSTGYTELIDLGVINFGNMSSLNENDITTGATITVQYKQLVATSITLYLYEVILMPVDEWSGIYNTIYDDWTLRLNWTSMLDIDAIMSARGPRALLRQNIMSEEEMINNYIRGEWNRLSRGGPILQANADQRIWFLTALGEDYISRFRAKYIVDVHRNARYLTMRGSA